MKFFKKVSASVLALFMVMGTVFVGSGENSYAAISYKKNLVEGVTYKCDLDGDKDLDTVKMYREGEKVLLKVNNSVKTVISKDAENYTYVGRIYDFNKYDKTLDIVLMKGMDGCITTRILKFKNNTCKLDETYEDASIYSYDSHNGMITLEEMEMGRYDNFSKAIGCFLCYDKVRINGYNSYKQFTANTNSTVRKNKYIANRNLTAYTDKNTKKKAFTIKEGSEVYVYSLYKNKNSNYIKIKSSQGKYGYVKIGTSLLFRQDSCLWWR